MRSQVSYWAAQGAEFYCMLKKHMAISNSHMLPFDAKNGHCGCMVQCCFSNVSLSAVRRSCVMWLQADARNRQGSHMGGVSNPLGPNHQAPLSNAPAEELRQSAQMQSMQLPVGSMITNPPIQPLTHRSSQLQSQPHFQQPLPNPRMYQSFTDALTESSQPLSAPSMHSMPSHGLNHDLYSESQGSAMAFQGYPSQPQAGQGLLSQPHAGQGMSMQSGQTEGSMNVHSSGGSLLANGMSFGQSLPDGSAQMSSHMQGKLLPHHYIHPLQLPYVCACGSLQLILCHTWAHVAPQACN